MSRIPRQEQITPPSSRLPHANHLDHILNENNNTNKPSIACFKLGYYVKSKSASLHTGCFLKKKKTLSTACRYFDV